MLGYAQALFTFMFLFTSQMEAITSNTSFDQVTDRIYIEPESVFIFENRIFLSISDNLVPITYLSCDSEGLYVSIEEILQIHAKNGTWVCSWCGELNNGGNFCTMCYKLRR